MDERTYAELVASVDQCDEFLHINSAKALSLVQRLRARVEDADLSHFKRSNLRMRTAAIHGSCFRSAGLLDEAARTLR